MDDPAQAGSVRDMRGRKEPAGASTASASPFASALGPWDARTLAAAKQEGQPALTASRHTTPAKGSVSIGFRVQKTKEDLRKATMSKDLHEMKAALAATSALAEFESLPSEAQAGKRHVALATETAVQDVAGAADDARRQAAPAGEITCALSIQNSFLSSWKELVRRLAADGPNAISAPVQTRGWWTMPRILRRTLRPLRRSHATRRTYNLRRVLRATRRARRW